MARVLQLNQSWCSMLAAETLFNELFSIALSNYLLEWNAD